MLAAPTPITSGFTLPGEGVNLEMLERDLVVQALQRAQGNQTQAAQLLGMNRDQIRYRLEKFGLDKLGRPMGDEKPA
jgi:two-component system, NtrC family, response regulator AtoC